ncbi:putative FERM domain-containing protein FRMD8P1 [Saccostrea cucullata]|uniref:putative FERM domain-containing protein FRMD8P1 n=1 Tax=Saccostrea cuccullata TaxID=36930 RepID=UPI002ED2AEE4
MEMGDSMDEETRRLVLKHQHDDPADDTVEVVIWMRDRVGIHVTLECGGHEATAEDLFEIVVEQRSLPPESENIFSIWLVSPLLELRLKKNHRPFQFAQLWDEFCALYTDAKPDEISRDEPVVMFQRNVFLTLEEEMRISDEVVLNLLYHEAKFNVIEGRYVLQAEEYDQLAGIQALIHLEHYNEKTHTLEHYKEELHKFYPAHMRKPKNTKFFKFSRNKNEDVEALEVRVRRAHRQISDAYKNTDIKQALGSLYRKYLEVCWQYAFYGSAFFEGKVQKQIGKIKGHLPGVEKDMDVLIALNTDGICIIDQLREEPMLAVPYEDLSWHLDTNEEEENRMAVLLLQFLVKNENGETITKVLQVFSSQAKMMDALIDSCVKRKLRREESAPDGPGKDREESGRDGPRQYRNENFCCKISNKLDKMTLSTFSLKGEMIKPS